MSPDDYDALYDESRDEPAFSNGTEGYGWMDANCFRCANDVNEDCPLILLTLVGRRPAQFLDGPRDENGYYGIATQYVCTEFRDKDSGPGPEPRPIPDPPGQLLLLPREPFEGHRMLTAIPQDTAVAP